MAESTQGAARGKQLALLLEALGLGRLKKKKERKKWRRKASLCHLALYRETQNTRKS